MFNFLTGFLQGFGSAYLSNRKPRYSYDPDENTTNIYYETLARNRLNLDKELTDKQLSDLAIIRSPFLNYIKGKPFTTGRQIIIDRYKPINIDNRNCSYCGSISRTKYSCSQCGGPLN
jgi:hypothetical protein